MRPTKLHIAWVLGVALLISICLFLLGQWLQGLYGLDPPYRVFYFGFFLQLAAFPIPLLTVVWLVIARWRYLRKV